MHRIRRFIGVALCALAGVTAALAQTSTATNLAPAAVSDQERLASLEKSLAEMRADLARLKGASTGASDATVAELERKIDVLGAEIEALKLGQPESPLGPKPRREPTRATA